LRLPVSNFRYRSLNEPVHILRDIQRGLAAAQPLSRVGID